MKKKVIICCCFTLFLVATIVSVIVCINQRKGRKSESGKDDFFAEQEKKDLIELYGKDYVYSFSDIYKVVYSDEFSKANVEKRERLLKPVLKELKKSGQIKDYSFNYDSHLPYVVVVNNNDVTVTIALDDFPERLNGIN